MDQVLRDVGLGFRMLRAHAAFTAVAIVTIALGIGASTALFSVVYGVWLNGYPYRNVGAILYPRAQAASGEFADSQNGVYRQREFLEIAKVPAVADAAAFTLGESVTVIGSRGPELVPSFRVSANTFQFLGVPAMLGRPIQPSDVRAGGDAEAVAVLSFNLWHGMFGAARDVVGQTVRLSGVPHRIVGVMPRRFGWGSASLPTNDGLWRPLPTTDARARLRVWVRLREGVTETVAAQQFHALFVELARIRPGSFPPAKFVTTFRQFSAGTGETRRHVERMRASLKLLLVAVGFLLLIACTNVANLQLARGSARTRDFAVRLAVGASRWRLFNQLLIENVLLAFAAGLAGLALAAGLTRLITALIPRGYVPSEAEIAIHTPVLVACLVFSAISGVLVGVIPAIQGSRSNLSEVLKDTGTRVGGRSGTRTRNVLVIAQVALSVVLVTGASLTVRGYVKLAQPDPGFDPARLFEVAARFPAQTGNPPATSAQREAFVRELPDRLRRLPTVEAATVAMNLEAGGYQVAGQPARDDTFVLVHAVGAGYVRTMGMRLRAGRDLSDADVLRGEPAALINEAARRLWPAGPDPVGQRIALRGLRDPADAAVEVTVVGIVRGAADAPPAVVLPHTVPGLPSGEPVVTVRTRHDEPLKSADAVRAEAFTLDPNAVLERPVDLAAELASVRLQPRFNAVLFGGLASIALVLAAAGLYSVLSYQVARQQREIGIRLALGADNARVFSVIAGTGARLVGLGLVVGVLGSVALERLVRSQAFAVPGTDPVALGGAVVVLGVVAACACYVPAWRATRISPSLILRSE